MLKYESSQPKRNQREVTSTFPSTPAVHFLRKHEVAFEGHLYRYLGLGNVAKDAAAALRIRDSEVFKTLVFSVGSRPMLVLVSAKDRVSSRALGKVIGDGREINECSQRDAERYSGYEVGAISPFGTRRPLPIYLDSAAMDLDRIFVNGGSHGFLVSVSPADLVRVLKPIIGRFGYH